MRVILAVFIFVSALLPAPDATGATNGGDSTDHPRLFVPPERLAEIREQIEAEGSDHALAFELIKGRVDNNRFAPGDGGSYRHSYRARESAMMALLAEDGKDAEQYADAAFEAFGNCDPLGGSGLARGMNSLGMAIAYDWCYDLWDDQQREAARKKVDEALDAWPDFRHANLGDVRGSNWVAVTRGGELVLLLAAGVEKKRADRYAFLKRELARHIRAGFGELGVTQEGIGYTEYPGAFLLPAVYACASIGDDQLMQVARSRAWWKLAMYSNSFQPHGRKTLMTGVTSGGTLDQGWSSLLLNLCPADQLPYYLYFYDRHLGRLSRRDADRRFDSSRAGTVWALLYYPEDVEAEDPTGIFPAGVADPRGYYFFRNRWQDENDIQLSIMADAHHHGHAWDQPEQLALNLLAWNSRFIGGPRKLRKQDVYSSLLVDGQYNIEDSTKLTGETVAFESDDNSGYAIVGGGALYKALGVDRVRRHLLVEFSLPDNQAVLSTLDRIRSTEPHTYTWQANIGNDGGDDGIETESGEESGRPCFLLTGRNGFVKGWVAHPADAKISAGDPLQIETSGRDADIWVVLFVGSGQPPEARIEGEGMESIVTVGSRQIAFDGRRISSTTE